MTKTEQEIFDRLWNLYLNEDMELDTVDMVNVLLFSAAAIGVPEKIPVLRMMDALLEYSATITETYETIMERHKNGQLTEEQERDLKPLLRLVHNKDFTEEDTEES